ncbi:GTP binding protein Era [Trichuris trichiura]|uniref:GTPase Era, mitochondrial n=1 Tax=Trichuris trichiura TaxID=36087 RepID=A0A077Z917_TRITR|nr:GTP binding protein Era [Trichuris trichiura]
MVGVSCSLHWNVPQNMAFLNQCSKIFLASNLCQSLSFKLRCSNGVYSYDRCIELDQQRQKMKSQLLPDGIPSSRFLRVAIIGAPNAGKSAMANMLIGATVSAVSSKINTTQKMMTSVLVDGSAQVVLMDTPGIVTGQLSKRHNLSEKMVTDPENSLTLAQQILVVVDSTNKYKGCRLSPKVQHLLYRYRHLPSALILNKVDLVKPKSTLLEMVHTMTKGVVQGQPVITHPAFSNEKVGLKKRNIKQTPKTHVDERRDNCAETDVQAVKGNMDLEADPAVLEKLAAFPAHKVSQSELHRCFRYEKGWPYFDAVFMVSALSGDGISEVREYLFQMTRSGSWSYHSSVVADEDIIFLACDIVRAKLLDHLPQEIPYRLKLSIITWEQDAAGTLCIRMLIHGEKSRWVKIIVGKDGRILRSIVTSAAQELRNLFQHEVYLRIDITASK